MWFIGVEVEQETSAPPLKKILDPPLRLYMKGVRFLSKMVNKRVREKLRGVELWGGAFPYNTMLNFPLGLTYLGSEVDNFGIQCFSLSLKMNVVISCSFKVQECII